MTANSPLSDPARRVSFWGTCVSFALLGGLLVQAGFDSWFYRGTPELWANVSRGEMIEVVAFVILNPIPALLFAAFLWWVGLTSAYVGWLALAGLIVSVTLWWRGIAVLVDRFARAPRRVIT